MNKLPEDMSTMIMIAEEIFKQNDLDLDSKPCGKCQTKFDSLEGAVIFDGNWYHNHCWSDDIMQQKQKEMA